MVAVTHSLETAHREDNVLGLLSEGVDEAGRELLAKVLAFVLPYYQGTSLGTGEPMYDHAVGTALIAASLRLDVDTRAAALLFSIYSCDENAAELILPRFGERIAKLVDGLQRLKGLHVVTRMTRNALVPEMRAQTEVMRKMLLAMVEDIRVVLLRLASRTQTLRYLKDFPGELRASMARESLDIYAPLANRLGISQLKWELEDLSFRYLEPETYKKIAKQIDERRLERQQFIDDAIARLREELQRMGVEADVYGRPKHIYSIWNKMRGKKLDFSQIYDVRALRVLVSEVRDCYTVLGIVHQLWTPIPKEFDDYISQPKGNNYQSLHTAVWAGDNRAIEVQIRTHEMHRHAELGVAAHWRYKEGIHSPGAGEYEDKIALLRSLLSWRDEITDGADWIEQFRRASFDDTIYVLTPHGRVMDLPRDATPVDFAYRLHTELGHRCRGAKVNGQLVPLNTKLENGQTVEIVTTKQGGPSRDWLNPQLGYLASSRARQKVKQFFAAQEEAELSNQGRQIIQKELAREGLSQANLDELARKLGFANAEALYVATGRGEVTTRAMLVILRGVDTPVPDEPEVVVTEARVADTHDRILVVGVGKLLTSLARCCKPAPPDPIEGFVTRGRGVSIHRADCRDYRLLAHRHPERVVSAQWGAEAYKKQGNRPSVYPVDIKVEASDRQGLLRDISDVLAREKLNVIGVNTQSKSGKAFMRFTIEVASVQQMQRAIQLVSEIDGVMNAERG